MIDKSERTEDELLLDMVSAGLPNIPRDALADFLAGDWPMDQEESEPTLRVEPSAFRRILRWTKGKTND